MSVYQLSPDLPTSKLLPQPASHPPARTRRRRQQQPRRRSPSDLRRALHRHRHYDRHRRSHSACRARPRRTSVPAEQLSARIVVAVTSMSALFTEQTGTRRAGGLLRTVGHGRGRRRRQVADAAAFAAETVHDTPSPSAALRGGGGVNQSVSQSGRSVGRSVAEHSHSGRSSSTARRLDTTRIVGPLVVSRIEDRAGQPYASPAAALAPDAALRAACAAPVRREVDTRRVGAAPEACGAARAAAGCVWRGAGAVWRAGLDEV